MIEYQRPDWPAGSNGAPLASQRRTSTGFSWVGGSATGPTLAAAREEEERRALARAKRAQRKSAAAAEAVG